MIIVCHNKPTSTSASATRGTAVDLTSEVDRTSGDSDDNQAVTLAIQPLARVKPEMVRVTKKKSREASASVPEATPSSSGTPTSTPSPSAPQVRAIVRVPGKDAINISLNKQFLTGL
ncbi:hypothetical protein ACH5RR_003533 [Cinchona calisaya]|uniref:Uncharacterized protein n=1 Tax=Cinchona calisaya TaxID=153742 RepID=A0ABD3AV09_9GENT